MGRILKMEFRRLFKSVYFYIFPAAIVIILAIEKLTADTPSPDDFQSISRVFDFSREVMQFAIVAAGIFMVYLWSVEYKKGFIKNIAGNVSGNHIITITRMITGSVVMIVYSVFAFLFGLVITLINYGRIVVIPENPYPASADMLPERFRANWLSEEQWRSQSLEFLFKWISEYMVLVLAGIAIIALALMLFELTRSSALGYITVMMIGFDIFETLISNLISLITDKIDIARQLILSQFRYLTGIPGLDAKGEITWLDPDPMWTFWLRTAIYVIIFTAGAIMISKKKDTV